MSRALAATAATVAAVLVAGLVAGGAAVPTYADSPPGGETTPPKITIGIAESPWQGWYAAPVAVTISATDASGLEGLSYQLTGAQTGDAFSDGESLGVTIAAQGTSTLEVVATDLRGNRATRTYGVGIDLTDPTLTVGGTLVDGAELVRGDVRTVQFECGDAPTGVASCSATVDGAPLASGAAVNTQAYGDYAVTITAVDQVGRTRERTVNYSVGGRPLTVLSPPVLEGNPTAAWVNAPLRVGGAQFQPTPGYFIYEWLVDGAHVADGPTFTPKASHLGKRVSVRAFGSLAGPEYAETRTPAVGNLVIERGPLQVTQQPAIEGSPTETRVGEELRAVAPWFVPNAATLSYRWYAGDVLVGTGARYTVQPGDAGRSVAVQATGIAPDYRETVTERSASVLVRENDFEVTRSPHVSGTVRVGQELEIAGGLVTPSATFVRNYWSVGGTVVETDVPRFRLTPGHAGKRLSCEQVFSSVGYADLRLPCLFAGGATSVAIPLTSTGTSKPPGVKPAPWKLLSRAGIVGKAKAGATLRVVKPRVSSPARRWTYQWLRNGKAIKGATHATYRVRRLDRGDRIAVRVVASSPAQPSLSSVAKAKRIRR